MLSKQFQRLAFLLAFTASITFAAHLEHDHAVLTNSAGAHCCLCHTAGVAASAPLTASYQPIWLVEPARAFEQPAGQNGLRSSESPRGPPLA